MAILNNQMVSLLCAFAASHRCCPRCTLCGELRLDSDNSPTWPCRTPVRHCLALSGPDFHTLHRGPWNNMKHHETILKLFPYFPLFVMLWYCYDNVHNLPIPARSGKRPVWFTEWFADGEVQEEPFAEVEKQHTWWFIPLSKWVITPVTNGISRVNPLITGVITHLLSGMNHQVWFIVIRCHSLSLLQSPCIKMYYPLVMTNSSPWKITMLLIGKSSIKVPSIPWLC